MALTTLIIDEESMAESISTVLKRRGYSTITATNGEEGLRKAYRYQPDIVIVDGAIASQDAWELLKFLRELSSRMPILLVINSSDLAHARRGIQLGANHCLIKPLSDQDLINWVESCISDADEEDE